MKTICFNTPTIEQVIFTISCEPEDIQVRGNVMASGDDDYDKEVEDGIIQDLENGNEWAWCTVKVTASYKGFTGVDYLGGCSYKSESEFKEEGGYYEDMKQQAYDDLINQLEDLAD